MRENQAEIVEPDDGDVALPQVDGAELEELLTSEDSALAAAVRRAAQSAEAPGIYASFGSAV